MKRLTLLILCAALSACGGGTSSSNPLANTDVTAKPWALDLQETSGSLGQLAFSLSAAQCGSVSGPACFSASNLTSSNSNVGGTPTSLTVGVPKNPFQGYGMTFNFQYVYNTTSSGTWIINGIGSFAANGNVSGTWQCDPSSPCGLSGQFTAGQQ